MRRGRSRGWTDLFVPVALIIIGAYLLLRELVPELPLSQAWPLGLMAVGALLIVASFGWRRR